MPIGKNSIKRVANNGYSNVRSEAPDMENSIELDAVAKPEQASKSPASRKRSASSKPKSEKSADKPAKKETQQIKTEEENNGSYINIGRDMPVYLL